MGASQRNLVDASSGSARGMDSYVETLGSISMSKTYLRLLAVSTVLVAGGFVGFRVIADDAQPSQESPSVIERLHEHLMTLHGGQGGGHASSHHGSGHHGSGLGGMNAQGLHHVMHSLDLTDEQFGHLRRIHETLITGFHGPKGDHAAQLQTFIERVDTGTLDATEMTIMLERHVDSLRASLGTVATEAALLINNLDDEQRAALVAHLEELAEHLQ